MWRFLILYKYRNHREMQIECTLVCKNLLTSNAYLYVIGSCRGFLKIDLPVRRFFPHSQHDMPKV